MSRIGYRIFTAGKIASLTLPNRLVRSATWDPVMQECRRVTSEVLHLYKELALGGVGLVITGGLPVYQERLPDEDGTAQLACGYDDLRIAGLEQLAAAVHQAGTGCLVVAQVETGYLPAGPSERVTPYGDYVRALTGQEIGRIIASFVAAIADVQATGFDGVQLNAAHGGLLSCFLSPYTNRREDEYGGTVQNRVRIVAEIIARARQQVSDFPILIKMNGTDYVPGGIDAASFPGLARAVQQAGVDAIEVSGGMWDCLVRSEEELGFRPVPAPEAHTRLTRPEQESYFLPYAERLDLDIPVILVGGNRDVERLEEIVRGRVDFVAMCRPLICEPDLPRRWLEGRGPSTAACIACNSCSYALYVHPGRPGPAMVSCIYRQDRVQYRTAQHWLANWVRENARGAVRQP
jgi:2,4-dienoyl-CoA reductase-like NADH-dependent reductase (Old Yellow Enzyme family)